MSAGTAKFDLETISEFQKELHLGENEDEEVTSNFYREYRKTTWYTHIPVKLKVTANENHLVYTVNNTFHWLRYVYMRQPYPALRVKDNYRGKVQICWPHNLGTNNVISAQLKFEDDTPQSFDHHWYDIYNQFYMKSGFRDHHNMCVGNIPALEKWNDFLCEYTTNAPQPFYFMREQSQAIPLLFCSLSTIEFHYRVRNKIVELLRMRVKGTKEVEELVPSHVDASLLDTEVMQKRIKKKIDVWREIPCNLKYIEGAGSSGTLKTPELWGRYAYITEEECRWWKECKDRHVYYIEDIISCDSTNASSFGKTVNVDLNGKTPAKAIFWVAENMAARSNRNFSNYTTNSENLYEGWNPIRKISLKFGGSPRLDDMDSDHFDKMEPQFHFPSPPCEAGYNAYSFANDSTSLDAEIGKAFDGMKATLHATLSDTNPYLRPVKESEEKQADIEELSDPILVGSSSGEFILRVRMLVMKKLVFEYDKEKKKFTITV